MRWVNLEPIIQSEVSQKEKDKYCIFTESRKMVMKNLFTGQQRRNMKNRIMDMGRGEERVRYMESNMETYITICKIDSQGEFAVWLKKLKQGLCINIEQWGGAGDGREVQTGGDVCIPMADSC